MAFGRMLWFWNFGWGESVRIRGNWLWQSDFALPKIRALARFAMAGLHGLMNDLIVEARRVLPNFSKGTSVVYFLRLRSGAIYVGASTDLEQRLADHVAGVACRTTLLDPPTALLRLETFTIFAEARSRETQLKRWSRAKKEALIAGEVTRLRLLSKSTV